MEDVKEPILATVHEAKLISWLADEIWHEHYAELLSKEQIDYMLGKFLTEEVISEQISGDYKYYLLNFNKQVVGFMAVVPHENFLYLSKIYLKKAFRGKGLARMGINTAISEAKACGFNKIQLNVNKDNVDSIAAYKKLGFVVVEALVNDIGHGFVMDDYVMDLVF